MQGSANCTCDQDTGYSWQQQATVDNSTLMSGNASSLSSGRCVKILGNITAAKEAASAFSAVLATGVAVSVAASVIASATIGGGVSGIASVVGGSAGAPLSSAGTSSGGRLLSSSPSSGSAWLLVDQIQLMNQLGAAQGGDASKEALAAFSSGFAWANYDLVFWPLFSSDAEADELGPIRRSADGIPAEDPVCALEEGYKMAKRVATCAGVLVFVFMLREACRRIYMRRNPKEASPPDMTYPAWEASGCAHKAVLGRDTGIDR